MVEAVQMLLDAGADANAANKTGDTAMHGAASNGLPAVIQLLVDRGARLDVKNRAGQTPLALTAPGAGQRGAGFGQPRPAPGLQKTRELLQQLGATN